MVKSLQDDRDHWGRRSNPSQRLILQFRLQCGKTFEAVLTGWGIVWNQLLEELLHQKVSIQYSVRLLVPVSSLT